MAKTRTPEGKFSWETKIGLGVSAMVLAACGYFGLREVLEPEDGSGGEINKPSIGLITEDIPGLDPVLSQQLETVSRISGKPDCRPQIITVEDTKGNAEVAGICRVGSDDETAGTFMVTRKAKDSDQQIINQDLVGYPQRDEKGNVWAIVLAYEDGSADDGVQPLMWIYSNGELEYVFENNMRVKFGQDEAKNLKVNFADWLKKALEPSVAEAEENPTPTSTATPRPSATWTPRPTPSLTPTDELTPTPEPTVEPLDSRYPSCTRGLYVVDGLATPRKAVTREDDGTKLPTGLSWAVGDSSNTYYDATRVYSCIDNIDGVVDPIFGDGAITMDIVFYDVYGNEHRYPARTNGYSFKNEPALLVPFQLNSESGWQDPSVENVRKKILDRNGAQAETMLATADRMQSLWAGSEPINLHKEFLDLLIKAVTTGKNFPEPLIDDFRIQIIALALY